MDLQEEGMGDIPTRPMRVKILYTFDQDHKTNCLARIPDVQHIPVIAIDDGNHVGVIELQQCIHAIVAASPEMLSRIDTSDFTIYAFDYSEYDTPLVGQGMLSTAVANAQPSHHQRGMITGRVCKNVMALFSNGVKETLEVKLRLTPVSKPMQTGRANNVESVQSHSPALSSGFDPNAWNCSGQQSQDVQSNEYFRTNPMPLPDGNRDMALVEDIFGVGSASSGSASLQQMPDGVGVANTPNEEVSGFAPAFATHAHSAPGSRTASPLMSRPNHYARNDLLRHQSFSGHTTNWGLGDTRPESRTSVRSEVVASTHQRQAASAALPQQHPAPPRMEVCLDDDGNARKRVKVTQTDWRGRSSFGSKSSDLRVTAATTASLQLHRPVPKRHTAPGTELEPPPRVPTPVPQRNAMLPQPRQPQATNARRSMLRQASTADFDFMSDIENFSDAIASSPEDASPSNSIAADGTPLEFPSSPPVMPGFMQPQPSSPGLPTLPPSRTVDSGYMSERALTSGNIMESLEHDDPAGCAAQHLMRDRARRPLERVEGAGGTAHPSPTYQSDAAPSEMDFTMENPGDMNQLPRKMLLSSQAARRDGSQGPSKRPTMAKRVSGVDKVSAPGMHDPSALGAGPIRPHAPGQTHSAAATEPPSSRRGSLALPPTASGFSQAPCEPFARKAPVNPPTVQRSHTTLNESELGSPAPSDIEDGRPRGLRRSGSGAPRRKIIEQRLHQSIRNGQPPQFCSHCGAIETPTWRKLYVKTCEGNPGPLDYLEGEGETVGVQVTERNQTTGESIKFLIRKSMKKSKDSKPGVGFEDVVVCNPCGLWFNKTRAMRPEDRWGKKARTRMSRKQKDAMDDEDPTADRQHHVAPAVEATSGPPTGRPRAGSMQIQQQRPRDNGDWNASQFGAAAARMAQSSPGRYQGSQQSPIEIGELTPRPTRRLLFPSPRREGEMKNLGPVGLQSSVAQDHAVGDDVGIQATMSSKEGLEMPPGCHCDANVFSAFTMDKENVGPSNDEIARLFEGSPSTTFKTPRKTPLKDSSATTTTPRTRRQLGHLLTTPTPGSRKRKTMTPNGSAANRAVPAQPAATVNDFMTSPSSSRYFLRSTPSRLERTPQNPCNSGTTPSSWSRHLARMLSDPQDMANAGAHATSPSQRLSVAGSDRLPAFFTPGRALDGPGWEGLEGLLDAYGDAEELE